MLTRKDYWAAPNLISRGEGFYAREPGDASTWDGPFATKEAADASPAGQATGIVCEARRPAAAARTAAH